MTSKMESTQFTIVDHQTLNGVWVNGRRIPQSQDFKIQVGDSIEISMPGNGNELEHINILTQWPHQNITFSVTSPTNETAGNRTNLKRKRTTEEDEPFTSQVKRRRYSFEDRPAPLSVRRGRLIKHLNQKLKELEQEDDERSSSNENDSPELLQMYSEDIVMLKHHVTVLESRNRQRGHLGADQAMAQNVFLQTVHTKIEKFEESLDKRKKQLEVQEQEKKEWEEQLKLQDAIREQNKMVQELINSQQRFKNARQAKKQELEKEKEEAKAHKQQVVTQVTEVMENELLCIICSEFLIETRILNCGHSFCHQCIYQWHCMSNGCPVCRTVIQSQTPCQAMDSYINDMLEKLIPDCKAERQQVINERNSIRFIIEMDWEELNR